MRKEILSILIIILQLLSLVLYLWPTSTKPMIHVSAEFIKLSMFGIANLIIIAIYSVSLFFLKKRKTILRNLPFVIFIIFLGILLVEL